MIGRPDRNIVKDRRGEGKKLAGTPAADIALWPSAGANEAFQMILKNILRQIVAGQQGLQSPNPGALHEMRVALRRLRSAIKLFPDMLTSKQSARILADLKWIGGTLSFARDVDVFIADIVLPLKTKYPDDARIQSLYRKCLDRQKAEHRRIRALLASRRFLMFSRRLAEAADHLNESRSAFDRPARAVVAEGLARMKGKTESGKRLKELGRRDLHRFRLRVKAMRYALELVRELVSGKPQRGRFDKMLTSLQHIQSALGNITDIAARRKTFERITGSSAPSYRPVKHRCIGRKPENARRRRKYLKRSIDEYDRFLRTRPFWK